jgi:putative flippase GtrA
MLGAIILVVCEYLLTDKLHIYYIYSNIIGIAMVFIINFTINRYTTWKSVSDQ